MPRFIFLNIVIFTRAIYWYYLVLNHDFSSSTSSCSQNFKNSKIVLANVTQYDQRALSYIEDIKGTKLATELSLRLGMVGFLELIINGYFKWPNRLSHLMAIFKLS